MVDWVGWGCGAGRGDGVGWEEAVVVEVDWVEAVVVEVGPGTDENKITVKKGDRIMYDKYAGTQVKIDGEDHLILRMSDIIAVIE